MTEKAIVVHEFDRRYSLADRVLAEVGTALEVLSGASRASRPNPAGPYMAASAPELSQAEARHAAGLMRVNHVGEVCAQALYRGQALMCKETSVRKVFETAAQEEVDHLSWCRDRIRELNSHTSLLNPLWYAGSFGLGVLASAAGRERNLGFMAETERQVEAHLERHLIDLPAQDSRSRAVVQQMKEDEVHHRETAEQHGGTPLPMPVRGIMTAMSKVMTTLAYRV
jgi:ubiquinone biosynthesis monooxygenase Coq7